MCGGGYRLRDRNLAGLLVFPSEAISQFVCPACVTLRFEVWRATLVDGEGVLDSMDINVVGAKLPC